MDSWVCETYQPPALYTWKSNEVVLDEVFKFLSIPDLKHVRLTWKKWAIVGSRILVRKTIIRLTGEVPDNVKDPVNFFELPHWRNELEAHSWMLEQDEDLWENDLDPRKYFSISSYYQFMKLTAFNSEFKPRNVAVYKIEDIQQLPMPYFSTVEKLQVVFYKPTKGYALLTGFHQLFPNLKSLQFWYIEAEEVSSGNVSSTVSVSSSRPTDTKLRSSIEELRFNVPADLANLDWSFLSSFQDLKTLQICWPGAFYGCLGSGRRWLHSNTRGMDRAYLDNNIFGSWLTSTKCHLKVNQLRQVTLRFDLTATNLTSVQTFFAETNAVRISLEVHGDIESVPEMIAGFHRKTVVALVLLHIACPVFLEWSALEIMSSLEEKGFFLKSAWKLTFRQLWMYIGWIHLEKERHKFVVQLKGLPYLDEILNDIAKRFPHVFSNYNYAYCHKTDGDGFGSNRVEALTRTAFLSREFLSEFYWNGEAHGIRRNQYLVLLCDIPGFQSDANLSFPQSSGKDMCSWSFFHVSESIVARWRKLLDDERANYVTEPAEKPLEFEKDKAAGIF